MSNNRENNKNKNGLARLACLCVLWAITTIAGLEALALYLGIDGGGLSVTVALIAGLGAGAAGFTLKAVQR